MVYDLLKIRRETLNYSDQIRNGHKIQFDTAQLLYQPVIGIGIKRVCMVLCSVHLLIGMFSLNHHVQIKRIFCLI